MINVLELDCNERLLRDEPDELINEWIRRSTVLQKVISQAEVLIIDPTFKRMDEKLLTSYIMKDLITDLREDELKADIYDSYHYLVGLDVTSTYYKAAMDKLYFESPYIVEGHKKLYGEESIFDFVRAMIEEKAAAPIFKELIQDKNGIIPEVECLRVQFLLDSVVSLKEKPLMN